MAQGHFRTDVQGLRAIAVGLVVMGHLATYEFGNHWISGGFIGVDVFFVISGFLITSLMLREAERTGRISLGAFYARRARRILPAATVALVVTVLFAALVAPLARAQAAAVDARWSAAFLANLHFAHIGTSYFDNTATSPLQHFWSLAVEEQFYLVWPVLLLLAVGRIRRGVLIALVGLVCVASLSWAIHLGLSSDPATRAASYFSSPARTYELGVGALIALIGVPELRARPRTAFGALGLLTLAGAALGLSEDTVFPGWQALIPAAATVALLVSGVGSATPVTRLLSLAPMKYLGDISYSLYLWHFPVIILAPFYMTSLASTAQRAAVELALMLAAATASHYGIERAFLRGAVAAWLKNRHALLLWPLALTLIIVGSTEAARYAQHRRDAQLAQSAAWWNAHPGAGVHVLPDSKPAASANAVADELDQAITAARAGAPFPASVGADELRSDVWQRDPRYLCDPDPRRAAACTLGDPDADTVVAVVGDSHAAMWLPALDRIGREEHLKIVRYVMVGCGPYRVVQASAHLDQPTCDAFRDWTLAQLDALHPDTVVLGARGYLFVKKNGDDDVATQWRRGVTETVTAIRAATEQVVLLGDVPARMDPVDCLTGSDGRQLSCFGSPSGVEVASNEVTRDAGEAAGGRYVDTRSLVCFEDSCPLVVGGDVLYQDGSHLTITWVEHVTHAFGELVAPLSPGS